MATLTNTGKGPRGVHTKGGLVYLEPGETRDLDYSGRLPGDVEEKKAAAKKSDGKDGGKAKPETDDKAKE